MKKNLIISVFAMSVACLSVQGQTTRKLSPVKAEEYGLVYSLPLTEIDVTVEVEKTVKTPGEFYQYAKKHLMLQPITASSVSWKLKSVTLSERGVADKSERYRVQFKAGSVPYIVINGQNFPLSINTEEAYEVKMPQLPEAREAEPTILETPAAAQAVTEDMLRSTSLPKRAEFAAARIVELRQNRSEVISGQAESMPSDGAAMKLALDAMNEQESALTAMFTGTTQTSTEVATYTYRPDSLDSQRVVLARLSALDGLVDADDLSGAPIYLDLKVTQRGEYPVNERGEEKRFPKGGLAYRIPGEAKVSVEFDGKKLVTQTLPLAQAGVVFGLDPNMFADKKAPSAAIFNPVTGAIVELKASNASAAAQ